MSSFAIYMHPHTCYTSKPVEHIRFVGHSYPYFKQVGVELAEAFTSYPTLAVREADYKDYLRVHTESYLDKLRMMASGKLVEELAKRASCPVLSVHVGGYKLPITISAAVSHVKVLANYW